MHKDIVILTSKPVPEDIFSGLDYIILREPNFQSAFEFNYNNETLTCDIIITDTAYPELGLLTEDKKILSNHNFETSVDNIFVVGNVKSDLSIAEQFQSIVNFLKDPQ